MQNFILPMECSFSGLQELMGLRNGPFRLKTAISHNFSARGIQTRPDATHLAHLCHDFILVKEHF